MFFRYLQLRHAFGVQFPTGPLPLEVNPLMVIIHSQHPKKLISAFYAVCMLLMPSATKLAYALKNRWEEDVGEIGDEEWGKAWTIVNRCPLSFRIA